MTEQPNSEARRASTLVRDSNRVTEALRKAADIARLRRELWTRVHQSTPNGVRKN